MIFFSFTGHCAEIDDMVCFCPQDTQDEIVQSAVSITDIMKQLSESKARFKWMVIDAYRNDPTYPWQKAVLFKSRNANSRAQGIQKIDNPPEGIALFQSCAAGEMSYEDASLKHGIFMYHFVNGLKGEADQDGNGELTLMEVCKYVTDKTVKESVEKYGEYQRPYLTGELSDFIVADNILKDGLTQSQWQKAEGLHQEAQKHLLSGEYLEAKTKISAARQINKVNMEYARQETLIDTFLSNQTKAEATAKKIAQQLAASEAARLKAEKEAQRLPESSQRMEEKQEPPLIEVDICSSVL